MSDYKPGDMAVATVRGVPNVRVFRTRDYWTDATDECFSNDKIADVRPLVVLDLEADQPGCLIQNLRAQANHLDERDFTTNTVAFLRRVADQIEAQTKPPKPAEPTGLGAVVEDSNGALWTNTHQVVAWVHQDRGRAHYRDIPVVRVLSEGVESC